MEFKAEATGAKVEITMAEEAGWRGGGGGYAE